MLFLYLALMALSGYTASSNPMSLELDSLHITRRPKRMQLIDTTPSSEERTPNSGDSVSPEGPEQSISLTLSRGKPLNIRPFTESLTGSSSASTYKKLAKHIKDIPGCPTHLQHIMSGIRQLWGEHKKTAIFSSITSYVVCALFLIEIAYQPDPWFHAILTTDNLYRFTQHICREAKAHQAALTPFLHSLNVLETFGNDCPGLFFNQAHNTSILDFSRRVLQELSLSKGRSACNRTCCLQCDESLKFVPRPYSHQIEVHLLEKHGPFILKKAYDQTNQAMYSVVHTLYEKIKLYDYTENPTSSKRRFIHTPTFMALFMLDALVEKNKQEMEEAHHILVDRHTPVHQKALTLLNALQDMTNPAFIEHCKTQGLDQVLGCTIDSGSSFSLEFLEALYSPKNLFFLIKLFALDNATVVCQKLKDEDVTPNLGTDFFKKFRPFFKAHYTSDQREYSLFTKLTKLSSKKTYSSILLIALSKWLWMCECKTLDEPEQLDHALLTFFEDHNPADFVFRIASFAIQTNFEVPTFAKPLFKLPPYEQNPVPLLKILSYLHSQTAFFQPLTDDWNAITAPIERV